MNSQPPARDGRQGNWDGLSKSRGAASFGHGACWWFCTIGRIEWSIALSVPLGLMAIFLVAIAPAIFGDGVMTDRTPEAVRLASVWVVGLAIQIAITQTLFCVGRTTWTSLKKTVWGSPSESRAKNRESDNDAVVHSVTLTMGGVWIAIPDLVLTGARFETTERPEMTPLSVLESFGGASRVLVLWSVLLLTLGLGVMGCLIIDTVTTTGTAIEMVSTFAAENGTSNASDRTEAIAAVDRPWIAAAWILCLQGFWQLLPLPQSLGRVGWSAAIGLFVLHPESNANERVQAQYALRIVRWWLIAGALATLVIGVLAIQSSGIRDETGGRVLPALAGVVLLALWMFVSTRSEDLFASQMTLAGNQETGVLKSRVSMRSVFHRWRAARQQRERTRRLIAVVQQERAEASDAARVDEILQRLHADGPAALTDEERAILGRVSEAIRRERARDDHNPQDR